MQQNKISVSRKQFIKTKCVFLPMIYLKKIWLDIHESYNYDHHMSLQV